MNLPYCVIFIAVSGLCAVCSAQTQTVTIDFDTGTPAVAPGLNTPFNQSAGGVTAEFSSPAGPAFSIQSDATTRLTLSKFSGKYLYDNDLTRSVLQIRFSRQLTAIAFTFATGDYEIEVPSDIQLTAYLDSTTTPPVGSTVTHGTYANDSFPMGTLSFNSSGTPFNLVEITVPFREPRGATVFLVDNIVLRPRGSETFSSVCAASFMNGGISAPGSIVSGFGTGLSQSTEGADTQPPPANLANTTVTLKDGSGVEHPVPLFFVSPEQINYLIEDEITLGPATLTVTSDGQVTATGSVMIEAVAPGLFTANFDGKGVPAANAITVAADLSQTVQAVAQCGAAQGSCVPSPIDLGPAGTQVVLVLYGTGIRGRTSLAGVTVKIGGMDAEVQYAGRQPEFAGLDQVNVLLPRELAGRGEVDVVLKVDGHAANLVRVNIK